MSGLASIKNEGDIDVSSINKNIGDQKLVNVDNVAFADAVARSNVRPFSKRMLQLYGFCFVATLNSCINGYDGSLMSAINAMKPYQEQFNMKDTGKETPLSTH